MTWTRHTLSKNDRSLSIAERTVVFLMYRDALILHYKNNGRLCNSNDEHVVIFSLRKRAKNLEKRPIAEI